MAGTTDEEGTIAEQNLDTVQPDPVVLAMAQQIVSRLTMPRHRIESSTERGSGQLFSMPYREGSDDIDLDQTLEKLAEKPRPEDEDIIVRDRARTRRSVVVAVDVSGSMRGERVRTAAATVGAMATELKDDDLAVIAFWSDAAIVSRLGDNIQPIPILNRLLQLPAQGLTNVAFPVKLAAKQLAATTARDARVLLLSDCVHNAGPDPRDEAARLPRLDVLVDASGEHDVELGRDLAHIGHGRIQIVRSHREVPAAISALFHS